MAVYRIGDILRMKREALEITREELCEKSGEICSVQTLYRIECGTVKVKQKVYQKLMECMGELPERSYASVFVTDYQALNLKVMIDILLINGKYEEAEQKLKELELFLVPEYVRNQQYLLKVKSTLAYYQQQISAKEHLENLWKALRYTVQISSGKLEKWPLNCEEFDIIATITGVYNQINQKEESEKVFLKLLQNTERNYMDDDYYVFRHVMCFVGLSQLACLEQQHEISMGYCIEGMKESKSQRILGGVDHLMYDISWNKEKMIQKELLDKKERESCKKLLVQAYYLSVAQGVKHSTERIKRLCERYHPGEITLL